MTPEEQIQKIEEIYNEAIREIEKLNTERQKIISLYIKELETKKIEAIRVSIGLSNNS
jgi:mRNA-degrading endonuclease RelE of RelBE toxin-antitoxin system